MMALPYNREIIEKAGLNEPSATWGDPEWNWDAYIDMAKKTTITEGGSISTMGASNMGTGALVGNLPFLWGGQWVSRRPPHPPCATARRRWRATVITSRWCTNTAPC